MNYSTLYPKMTYLLVDSFFFNIALIWRFSIFREILTSDCWNGVIQSVAPYVTIEFKDSKHDRGFTRFASGHSSVFGTHKLAIALITRYLVRTEDER